MKKNENIHNENPDIVLVICPPWGLTYPPLGIASLSTFLRNKGFKTLIFDFNISLYNSASDQYKKYWKPGYANHWNKESSLQTISEEFKEDIRSCIEDILSYSPDVVGFSVLSPSQDNITAQFIHGIKRGKPEVDIIVGGCSVTVPKQRDNFNILVPGLVSAYVIGEGEDTLCELLKSLKSQKSIEGIPGSLIYTDKEYKCFSRPLKNELSEYPFPTFEEFDSNNYEKRGIDMLMELSRGCVGKCPFCSTNVTSPIFRGKTAEWMLDALKYYNQRYNTKSIYLVDSAINGDLKFLEEICDLLIKSDLDIKLSALAIPRHEMNPYILDKMKRAGFIRIEYGIESGSDKILTNMKKMYRVKDAEKALKSTHDADIMTVIFLLTGYPGEGEIEFQDTLEFLKRNSKHIDLVKSVNPLFLMSGSFIYNNFKSLGIKLPNADPEFKWSLGEENTYEIRLARVKKIRSVLTDLGVEYVSEDTVFEKQID